MRNIFTLTLAALALGLFNAFISGAYGHSLVFGPELFYSESGKNQRIVKSFSVQDTGQKFFVSVQSGASGEKSIVRGAIKINGKLIFAPAVVGKQSKMFVKRVKLQKQNNISVDVASDVTAPIVVAIMSLKEQTMTAKFRLSVMRLISGVTHQSCFLQALLTHPGMSQFPFPLLLKSRIFLRLMLPGPVCRMRSG